jgi:hypothetical protein
LFIFLFRMRETISLICPETHGGNFTKLRR